MKNKKTIVIILVIVAVISSMIFALHIADKIIFENATKSYPQEQKLEEKASQKNMSIFTRMFWNLISIQFDKEEAEREARIEAGLPVRGKDTALIWQDKYDITVSTSGATLDIYIDGNTQVVLEKVRDCDVEDETLYVISDVGYAVIDKENHCRVFISVPLEELRYTSQHSGSIEDEHVRYLSSYQDFSEYERDIFNKLKEDL